MDLLRLIQQSERLEQLLPLALYLPQVVVTAEALFPQLQAVMVVQVVAVDLLLPAREQAQQEPETLQVQLLHKEIREGLEVVLETHKVLVAGVALDHPVETEALLRVLVVMVAQALLQQ